MDFTAIIKKGQRKYTAICTEVDVVSEGYTVEEAMENLKESVQTYVEKVGWTQGSKAIVATFEI